jgi:hypothetical protein
MKVNLALKEIIYLIDYAFIYIPINSDECLLYTMDDNKRFTINIQELAFLTNKIPLADKILNKQISSLTICYNNHAFYKYDIDIALTNTEEFDIIILRISLVDQKQNEDTHIIKKIQIFKQIKEILLIKEEKKKLKNSLNNINSIPKNVVKI